MKEDMPELIRLDRLCQVLIRCGQCRLTCAAQDVQHIISCIDAGGDYVRDVSFPVGAFERAETWQPDVVVTPFSMLPKGFVEPLETVEMCRKVERHTQSTFNEADCGGVFDGFQVTSDADPGL